MSCPAYSAVGWTRICAGREPSIWSNLGMRSPDTSPRCPNPKNLSDRLKKVWPRIAVDGLSACPMCDWMVRNFDPSTAILERFRACHHVYRGHDVGRDGGFHHVFVRYRCVGRTATQGVSPPFHGITMPRSTKCEVKWVYRRVGLGVILYIYKAGSSKLSAARDVQNSPPTSSDSVR